MKYCISCEYFKRFNNQSVRGNCSNIDNDENETYQMNSCDMYKIQKL